MTTYTTITNLVTCGECSRLVNSREWVECMPCNIYTCNHCYTLHKYINHNENMENGTNATDVTIDYTSKKVDHPNHYHPGTYEAINVIEAWDLEFCLGNAVKYISRAGHKEAGKEIEDLEKASWYLSRRIEYLKKKKVEAASNDLKTFGG